MGSRQIYSGLAVPATALAVIKDTGDRDINLLVRLVQFCITHFTIALET